jgi:hypothetical protein
MRPGPTWPVYSGYARIESSRSEVAEMLEQRRRWPSIDEVIEKAKRGIIDDTMDAVPPYDLEDWEISGEPELRSEPDTQPRAS